MQKSRYKFNPCIRKFPWMKKQQPTPVFLPGASHGQRSLRAAVHRVAKSQTCFDHESDIGLYIFYIFIINASSRACYRTWQSDLFKCLNKIFTAKHVEISIYEGDPDSKNQYKVIFHWQKKKSSKKLQYNFQSSEVQFIQLGI